MLTPRSTALAFLLLGSIGSIVCVISIVIVAFAGTRLQQTNASLFSRLDEFMEVASNKVLDAQQVLDQSKLTAERLNEGLHEFTKREAREEIVDRLDLEGKTTHISQAFQQADQLLARAAVASDDIQELLELGQTLGLSTDPSRLEPLEAELVEMRSKLADAIEQVGEVRRWTGPADQEGEKNEAAQLVVGIVATLSNIDARLGSTLEAISGLKSRLDRLGSKLQWWSAAATVVVCLMIGWMGLGQAFVCAHGWKRYRQA